MVSSRTSPTSRSWRARPVSAGGWALRSPAGRRAGPARRPRPRPGGRGRGPPAPHRAAGSAADARGLVPGPEWGEVGAAGGPGRSSCLSYRGPAPPVRAFYGASAGPGEAVPAAAAHAELARIVGITGSPLWSRAFTWPRGLPRYKPGHAGHVAAVRERLARLAPLAIAGAGFDGAGVSACVKSGREAARGILKRIGS